MLRSLSWEGQPGAARRTRYGAIRWAAGCARCTGGLSRLVGYGGKSGHVYQTHQDPQQQNKYIVKHTYTQTLSQMAPTNKQTNVILCIVFILVHTYIGGVVNTIVYSKHIISGTITHRNLSQSKQANKRHKPTHTHSTNKYINATLCITLFSMLSSV